MVIDGTNYKCEWVKGSLTRTADILNGENSGRLQGTNTMYLDYVGTFFNYKGQLRRKKDCTDAEWEQIYLVLANPINRHTVQLPFGQNTLTQEVYISQIVSKLIDNNFGWERIYEVTFVAIESMWLAGQSLRGVS